LLRWDASDRALVSAVTLERADKCQSCGTSGWEWAEDPYAYDPVLVTCPGCQRKEILAADDTPRPKGTTIRLVGKHMAARLAREAAQRPAQRPRRKRVARRTR
jgi:hypothetical protein